ncbi:MAG: hypothetical protein R2911_00965 [Caldilineaceae bacterium]
MHPKAGVPLSEAAAVTLSRLAVFVEGPAPPPVPQALKLPDLETIRKDGIGTGTVTVNVAVAHTVVALQLPARSRMLHAPWCRR